MNHSTGLTFLIKSLKTDLYPIFYHMWGQIRRIHLCFNPFGTRSGKQYRWVIIPLANYLMGFNTFGKIPVYRSTLLPNSCNGTYVRRKNYIPLLFFHACVLSFLDVRFVGFLSKQIYSNEMSSADSLTFRALIGILKKIFLLQFHFFLSLVIHAL